jgi:hypothetical protein
LEHLQDFYSSYSGLSLNEATSFLSSAGISVLIDFGIKIIERKIIKRNRENLKLISELLCSLSQ